MPPPSMLNTGKQVSHFFDSYETRSSHSNENERKYKLKSVEQYSREHGINERARRQYYKATTLSEIINTAPVRQAKSPESARNDVEKGNLSLGTTAWGVYRVNDASYRDDQSCGIHRLLSGAFELRSIGSVDPTTG